MRLGVLGGTFDPIHNGHIALGRAALAQLSLDRVLYMPAGEQWRKSRREIAPAEHRLEMVRLAIANMPGFEASTVEVDREGPTYTVETLVALREEMPEAEFYFIVGADALADMPHWREPERIFDLATVCVADRSGGKPADKRAVPIEMEEVDVSSSQVRERVRAGLGAEGMVPRSVATYIAEHGLYR